jgi:hypothetical protein
MADRNEIEIVLTNWIRAALYPPGELPAGTDSAAWIASRFIEWWEKEGDPASIKRALEDAESAALALKEELIHRGGWEVYGNLLHEHIHLSEALVELRYFLGLKKI